MQLHTSMLKINPSRSSRVGSSFCALRGNLTSKTVLVLWSHGGISSCAIKQHLSPNKATFQTYVDLGLLATVRGSLQVVAILYEKTSTVYSDFPSFMLGFITRILPDKPCIICSFFKYLSVRLGFSVKVAPACIAWIYISRKTFIFSLSLLSYSFCFWTGFLLSISVLIIFPYVFGCLVSSYSYFHSILSF